MLSRWSRAGLTISISICVGTLLIWARSYFYSDGFFYPCNQYSSLSVGSHQGNLRIAFQTNPNPPLNPTRNFRWSSPRIYDGWRYLVFRSMIDFQYENRVIPVPGHAAIRTRILRMPMWGVLVLTFPIPAWVLFRNRRNLQWQLRKDVSWINPRLRSRIARFTLLSAIGSLTGVLVAWVDIEFPFNRSRWQWFVALWILLPVVSLMAVFTRRRIRWHRALLWMSLELAGCLCFFQATIERIWTHYNTNLYDVPDLLELVFMTGVACFIFGATLLLFLQVKPEPVKPGPYCPECGYCLIGSPRQICSECGRPFTLEELKITAEELIPQANHAVLDDRL
jgi:hypothetical protein